MASFSDGSALLQRHWPITPNLQQLKKQAKERLRAMRDGNAAATLARAQAALARDYGFSSWRALRAAVAPDLDRFTGHYRRDPNVMPDSILTFTSRDGRLFVQGVGGGRTPLQQVELDVFIVKDTGETYRFERLPGHPARRVVIGEGFKTIEALRTDAGACKHAEAAFARALADEARPRTRVDLDPRILAGYVGTYACPVGHIIEVTLSGDRLLASVNGQSRHELQAERTEQFFSPELSCLISFQTRDGRADALTVQQHGRVMIHQRALGEAALAFVEEIKRRSAEQQRPRKRMLLSAGVLNRYVGRYRLDEHSGLTVSAVGDRLFGEFTGQSRLEIFAEDEARFFTNEDFWLTFLEDDAGHIDRLIVHQPGLDLMMMREALPAL